MITVEIVNFQKAPGGTTFYAIQRVSDAQYYSYRLWVFNTAGSEHWTDKKTAVIKAQSMGYKVINPD